MILNVYVTIINKIIPKNQTVVGRELRPYWIILAAQPYFHSDALVSDILTSIHR